MTAFSFSKFFDISHNVKGVDGVIYVGDMHLDCVSPSSRVDNFPQTMLDKFTSMTQQFHKIYGDNFIIVLLGDVFHRNNQSVFYLNEVLSCFRSCSALCKGIFSIVGNHDIAYARMDTIMKSPFRALLESGYLKLFGSIELVSHNYSYLFISGAQVYEPCLFREEATLKAGSSDLGQAHLCAHRFYKAGEENTLQTPFIKECKYDAVILGHDHVQYPIETVANTKIVRPGAFSRGTAHFMNLVRGVDVAQYNLDHKTFTYTPVACKDSKLVFTSAAYNKEQRAKPEIKVVSDKLMELVTLLETRKGSNKVYTVLDAIQLNPTAKKLIESYLISEGVYREKGEN